MWLLCAAWVVGTRNNSPWWWIAPTYQQCRHGFTILCRMAVNAGIMRRDAYTTTPPLQAKLENGVRFEGRSWERPENLMGPTIMGAVVDEFGQLNDQAYGFISSRRAESVSWGNGFIRWLGNVGDVGGPAESLWTRAEQGESGFAYRRWTWRDRAAAHDCNCGELISRAPVDFTKSDAHTPICPRGIYLRFVRDEASRLSGPQFRQLYEAEWVDWNLLPAYAFDRDLHVSTVHDYVEGLPIDLSCDFNVSPMAWIIGQHKNGNAWDFDEVALEGRADTAMACNEVLAKLDALETETKRLHVHIYGDASGKARDTRSKTTDYEIIERLLGPRVCNLSFHVPAGNPAVSARLNAVNATMAPALGEPRYGCHPRCVHLANDWARVSLKPGTREIDKTDKRKTHFSDAAGYRLVRLYPVIDVPRMSASAGGGRMAKSTGILGMDF